MTKFALMARDARGASAIMMAIVAGWACVFWVEISNLTGVYLTDLIEVCAYQLGIKLG